MISIKSTEIISSQRKFKSIKKKIEFDADEEAKKDSKNCILSLASKKLEELTQRRVGSISQDEKLNYLKLLQTLTVKNASVSSVSKVAASFNKSQ